jgi:pimeloyl-ACP methyl ester carboxylesterase
MTADVPIVGCGLPAVGRRGENRPVKLRCVVGAVFVLALLPAGAGAQIDFCGPSARACAHLTVPLDWSRHVVGSVRLEVERRRAKAATEPPVFLLAGGPGQSATRAFRNADVRAILGRVWRDRDVVVFDQRGTGDSGALICPLLQRVDAADVGPAAEQCAGLLGPARSFYTTADSVADIEAVRAALGYQRIALLAVSYGTKVALDYAARYPGRVDRLVLDSAVPPGGVDPLYRASFTATPRVLRDLCRGRCRGITPDPVKDLMRLMRRLKDGPLRGVVVDRRGHRRRAVLTGFDLFSTFVVGDLASGIRARFPAAARAAVIGDTAPLLRLARYAGEDVETPPQSFSAATYAATVCEETALPWDPAAPLDQRLAQARARVAAEPPAAFAPFDAKTALESDVLALCAPWPAGRAVPAPTGPPRDVPVLILSGSQDVRTPRALARRVAGLFSHAAVVRVSGAGHSVIGSDVSGCAVVAARRFLTGRALPRACPHGGRPRPTPRDPTSLRAVRPAPGTSGRPGRTLAAVRRTYQDALRLFFERFLDQAAVEPAVDSFRYASGGLRAGSSTLTLEHAVLRKLVYVPGVRVSGRLRSVSIFPNGVLHIGGRAAARGRLRVRNGVMSGRLGSRRVRGRLGPDLFDLVLADAFASHRTAATAALSRHMPPPSR